MEPVLETVAAPPPIPSRREFSVGAVIARTFSIWSRNFPVFTGVALLVNLPTIGLAVARVEGPRAPAFQALQLLVSSVLAYVTAGALTAGVLQALRGERLGVGRMLAIGLRKVGPLFVVSLAVGLMVGCGAMLLIVPGLIAMSACYVAIPALVAEGKGIGPAIERSWNLTKGHRWGALAVALVFQAGVTAIVLVILSLVPLATAGSAAEGAFTAAVVQIVAGISHVAPAIAYHDLRVEKEGVSTAELAAVFE